MSEILNEVDRDLLLPVYLGPKRKKSFLDFLGYVPLVYSGCTDNVSTFIIVTRSDTDRVMLRLKMGVTKRIHIVTKAEFDA